MLRLLAILLEVVLLLRETDAPSTTTESVRKKTGEERSKNMFEVWRSSSRSALDANVLVRGSPNVIRN